MTVEIQDEPLLGLRLTPERFKLEAAVGLYAGEDVTLGQAAAFAGVSQPEFLHALGQHGICVHYDLDEFEADVLTLKKLGRIPQR